MLLVETPRAAVNWPVTFRPGWCRYVKDPAKGEAMRGCDRDHDSAGPRPGGRRGGVPRAHRPPPARAAAALLPDPRLGPGCQGHAAGDPAGRLARARPV